LSKLFDQLKDAARSREESSPGLLANALKRQQENAAAVSPAQAGAQSPELVSPAQAGAQSAPWPAAPSPDTRISRYSGVGLAIIIFAVAVLAWRSAPWTPPRKHKIDPASLKLDRALDLQRVPSKGTSPGGTPS
jgi:hypothetical protein